MAKVRRVPAPISSPQPSLPKHVAVVQKWANGSYVHPALLRLYKHVCVDEGTIDEMRSDDILILILNPKVKQGSFKRKSYGTLHDRTILYIDTVTGYMEIRKPSDWREMDPAEIFESLKTKKP